MLAVNTRYYHDITGVDGESPSTSALLDRTLAHELNHALLATNIKYHQKLPKFITEGVAEVVHGIDDERRSSILKAAKNNDVLAAGFNDDSNGSPYVSGYLFWKFFTRQAVLQTLFDDIAENPKLISLSDDDDDYLNEKDGATIAGSGGNDTLNNNGRNSVIDGGSGNDELNNGKIIYSEIDSPFDDSTNVASFGNTDVTLKGGSGEDTIRVDVTSDKRDSSDNFISELLTLSMWLRTAELETITSLTSIPA